MKMSESAYSRGDRIAVARACKAARLEAFGNGAKPIVSPDLAPGETVELAASVKEDANTASDEELQAAADLLEKIAQLDAEAAAAK